MILIEQELAHVPYILKSNVLPTEPPILKLLPPNLPRSQQPSSSPERPPSSAVRPGPHTPLPPSISEVFSHPRSLPPRVTAKLERSRCEQYAKFRGVGENGWHSTNTGRRDRGTFLPTVWPLLCDFQGQRVADGSDSTRTADESILDTSRTAHEQGGRVRYCCPRPDPG